VIEFYGATEGNTALFNLDLASRVGRADAVSGAAQALFPIKIVAYDVEDEYAKNATAQGHCIEWRLPTKGLAN